MRMNAGAPKEHADVAGDERQGRRPRRGRGRENESGAVLILALVYIIAISLVVGALARWATDDLDNTNNFGTTSQVHSAVTSVMNTAIESMRYTPWPSGTGGSSATGETALPANGVATGWGWCWQPTSGTVSSITLTAATTSSNVTANSPITVDVYCNTVEKYKSNHTRTVTLAACLSTTSAASCEASPLLSAVVVYNDYPAGGGLALLTQCNIVPTSCGDGQSLTSWVWL